MPNWAEGSLKLRGKKENIAQALNVEWNSHRKLKFPKVKLSKMFVGNTMIINGKSLLAIWEDKMTEGVKSTLL